MKELSFNMFSPSPSSLLALSRALRARASKLSLLVSLSTPGKEDLKSLSLEVSEIRNCLSQLECALQAEEEQQAIPIQPSLLP